MKKTLKLFLTGLFSLSLMLTSCGKGGEEEEQKGNTPGEQEPTKVEYTIKFVNGQEELQSSKVEQGQMPVYSGATPTKESTVELDYTFNGWEPALVAATADATYSAKFTSSPRKYTITWMNGEQEISHEQVAYGTVPTSPSQNPTKESTIDTQYNFDGWALTANGEKLDELPAVSGDAVYYAHFASTVRQYLVTWMNGEEEFTHTNVDYNTVPTVPTGTPEKESSNTTNYTFDGWAATPDGAALAEIPVLTGDTTYYAHYAESVRKYTIKFMSGETVLQTDELEYGDMPAYTGADPEKEASDGISYRFKGWDKTIVAVAGDVTYNATFHEIDAHGICKDCGTFFDSTKIKDYAVASTAEVEDIDAAPGFEKVYGKTGFTSGKVGVDLDISGYTTLYFAIRHDVSYIYLFGGNNEYATLWQGDWYQVLLERDADYKWNAFYKKTTEESWSTSKLDDDEKTASNLYDLLRMYNWNAEECAAAKVRCSEVLAIDRHEHKADSLGLCEFCGTLINKVKIGDYAVKNSTLTNEVAPKGFESVYTVTGLSNGNNGTDIAISSYKAIYFMLKHDIGNIMVFGGNADNNPVLWKDDWYNILLTKESTGWVAHYKKSHETSWNTDHSKVDGATDTNFSSILRLYNWSDLASANVKCTEVYGVLAD